MEWIDPDAGIDPLLNRPHGAQTTKVERECDSKGMGPLPQDLASECRRPSRREERRELLRRTSSAPSPRFQASASGPSQKRKRFLDNRACTQGQAQTGRSLKVNSTRPMEKKTGPAGVAQLAIGGGFLRFAKRPRQIRTVELHASCC